MIAVDCGVVGMEITDEMLEKAVAKGMLIALEEGKLKLNDITGEKRAELKNRLRANPELVGKILADRRGFKNVISVIRASLK